MKSAPGREVEESQDKWSEKFLSRRQVLARFGALLAATAGLLVLFAAAGEIAWDGGLILAFSDIGYYRWRARPSGVYLWCLIVAGGVLLSTRTPRQFAAAALSYKPRIVLLAIWSSCVAAVFIHWEFPWEFTLAAAVLLSLLFLAVWEIVPKFRSILPEDIAARLQDWAAHPFVFPGAIVAVALMLLSQLIYQRMPFVIDSVLQWHHARMLLGGEFKVPAPGFPEFFGHNGVVLDETAGWFPQYTPGHVLLIALFEAFRASWILNPLMGAGIAVLVFVLGKHHYGTPTGYVAAALLLVSPYFLIMQSGMMNHGTVAFFLLLILWLTLNFREAGRPYLYATLIGLAAGYCLITRPLTAAGYLLPAFVYGLWKVYPALPRKGSAILACACGLTPMLAVFFFFNWKTTGSPFVSGYHMSHPDMHRLGFDDSFSLVHGIAYSLNNIYSMNQWLFGWPIGSFLPILVLFLFGRWSTFDRLLAATCISLSAAYTLYRYQDFWYGPRFLYEALPLMALLSARGIMVVWETIARLTQEAGRPGLALPVVAAPALVMFVFGALYFRHEMFLFANRQANEHLALRSLAEELQYQPNAVVFIRERRRDPFLPYNFRYPDGPLFPADLGERNQEFMQAFPGRQFYRLEGTTLVSIDENSFLQQE